uniref:Protein kinase domain-containing protein n=1 Tax=Macrostomum lignano TaxID=282301 RepID=A0A1I8JRT4_9PLAT
MSPASLMALSAAATAGWGRRQFVPLPPTAAFWQTTLHRGSPAQQFQQQQLAAAAAAAAIILWSVRLWPCCSSLSTTPLPRCRAAGHWRPSESGRRRGASTVSVAGQGSAPLRLRRLRLRAAAVQNGFLLTGAQERGRSSAWKSHSTIISRPGLESAVLNGVPVRLRRPPSLAGRRVRLGEVRVQNFARPVGAPATGGSALGQRRRVHARSSESGISSSSLPFTITLAGWAAAVSAPSSSSSCSSSSSWASNPLGLTGRLDVHAVHGVAIGRVLRSRVELALRVLQQVVPEHVVPDRVQLATHAALVARECAGGRARCGPGLAPTLWEPNSHQLQVVGICGRSDEHCISGGTPALDDVESSASSPGSSAEATEVTSSWSEPAPVVLIFIRRPLLGEAATLPVAEAGDTEAAGAGSRGSERHHAGKCGIIRGGGRSGRRRKRQLQTKQPTRPRWRAPPLPSFFLVRSDRALPLESGQLDEQRVGQQAVVVSAQAAGVQAGRLEPVRTLACTPRMCLRMSPMPCGLEAEQPEQRNTRLLSDTVRVTATLNPQAGQALLLGGHLMGWIGRLRPARAPPSMVGVEVDRPPADEARRATRSGDDAAARCSESAMRPGRLLKRIGGCLAGLAEATPGASCYSRGGELRLLLLLPRHRRALLRFARQIEQESSQGRSRVSSSREFWLLSALFVKERGAEAKFVEALAAARWQPEQHLVRVVSISCEILAYGPHSRDAWRRPGCWAGGAVPGRAGRTCGRRGEMHLYATRFFRGICLTSCVLGVGAVFATRLSGAAAVAAVRSRWRKTASEKGQVITWRERERTATLALESVLPYLTFQLWSDS